MNYHAARTTLHAIEIGLAFIILPIITVAIVATIQRLIYSRRYK